MNIQTIPFGYQSPYETNYMFNPINSNHNSNTNNKEMKFTNDSYYQTLFPPFKQVTNLSYRPQEMNQDIIQSQKKENAPTNDTTINQNNRNDDIIVPTPMKHFLGKKELVCEYKE